MLIFVKESILHIFVGYLATCISSFILSSTAELVDLSILANQALNRIDQPGKLYTPGTS